MAAESAEVPSTSINWRHEKPVPKTQNRSPRQLSHRSRKCLHLQVLKCFKPHAARPEVRFPAFACYVQIALATDHFFAIEPAAAARSWLLLKTN